MESLMKNTPQHGSALIVVVVVLAIAVVGILGFFAWQNISQSSKPSDKTGTTKPEEKDPEYITLADWSVRLQLPEELALDNVKYSKNRIAEAPEYYALTTVEIVAQGDECATGYPLGDIVSLQRIPAADKEQYAEDYAAQIKLGGEINNGTAINGYVYYYQTSILATTPVPSCATTPLADEQRELLIEMTKSLKAV